MTSSILRKAQEEFRPAELLLSDSGVVGIKEDDYSVLNFHQPIPLPKTQFSDDGFDSFIKSVNAAIKQSIKSLIRNAAEAARRVALGRMELRANELFFYHWQYGLAFCQVLGTYLVEGCLEQSDFDLLKDPLAEVDCLETVSPRRSRPVTATSRVSRVTSATQRPQSALIAVRPSAVSANSRGRSPNKARDDSPVKQSSRTKDFTANARGLTNNVGSSITGLNCSRSRRLSARCISSVAFDLLTACLTQVRDARDCFPPNPLSRSSWKFKYEMFSGALWSFWLTLKPLAAGTVSTIPFSVPLSVDSPSWKEFPRLYADDRKGVLLQFSGCTIGHQHSLLTSTQFLNSPFPFKFFPAFGLTFPIFRLIFTKLVKAIIGCPPNEVVVESPFSMENFLLAALCLESGLLTLGISFRVTETTETVRRYSLCVSNLSPKCLVQLRNSRTKTRSPTEAVCLFSLLYTLFSAGLSICVAESIFSESIKFLTQCEKVLGVQVNPLMLSFIVGQAASKHKDFGMDILKSEVLRCLENVFRSTEILSRVCAIQNSGTYAQLRRAYETILKRKKLIFSAEQFEFVQDILQVLTSKVSGIERTAQRSSEEQSMKNVVVLSGERGSSKTTLLGIVSELLVEMGSSLTIVEFSLLRNQNPVESIVWCSICPTAHELSRVSNYVTVIEMREHGQSPMFSCCHHIPIHFPLSSVISVGFSLFIQSSSSFLAASAKEVFHGLCGSHLTCVIEHHRRLSFPKIATELLIYRFFKFLSVVLRTVGTNSGTQVHCANNVFWFCATHVFCACASSSWNQLVSERLGSPIKMHEVNLNKFGLFVPLSGNEQSQDDRIPVPKTLMFSQRLAYEVLVTFLEFEPCVILSGTQGSGAYFVARSAAKYLGMDCVFPMSDLTNIAIDYDSTNERKIVVAHSTITTGLHHLPSVHLQPWNPSDYRSLFDVPNNETSTKLCLLLDSLRCDHPFFPLLWRALLSARLTGIESFAVAAEFLYDCFTQLISCAVSPTVPQNVTFVGTQRVIQSCSLNEFVEHVYSLTGTTLPKTQCRLLAFLSCVFGLGDARCCLQRVATTAFPLDVLLALTGMSTATTFTEFSLKNDSEPMFYVAEFDKGRYESLTDSHCKCQIRGWSFLALLPCTGSALDPPLHLLQVFEQPSAVRDTESNSSIWAGAFGSTTSVDEMGMRMVTSAVERTRKGNSSVLNQLVRCIKLAKNLEIAALGQPLLTAEERNIAFPKDLEYSYFDGKVEYLDAPSEPVRLAASVRLSENNDSVREFSTACTWFCNMLESFTFLPSSIGGQCRSRVDDKSITLYLGGAFEIQLVVEAHTNPGDTSGTISFPMKLAGTLNSRGSILGNVTLIQTLPPSEEESVPSVLWLKQGVAGMEKATDGSVLLLAASELNISSKDYAEVLQKIASSANSFAAKLSEIVKQEFPSASQTFVEKHSALVLWPRLAGESIETRDMIVSNLISQRGELLDPLLLPTFSAMFGESAAKCGEWLVQQHLQGLPSSTMCQQNALVIRFLLETAENGTDPITIVLNDPNNLMRPWLSTKVEDSNKWRVSFEGFSNANQFQCSTVLLVHSLVGLQEVYSKQVVVLNCETNEMHLTSLLESMWTTTPETLERRHTIIKTVVDAETLYGEKMKIILEPLLDEHTSDRKQKLFQFFQFESRKQVDELLELRGKSAEAVLLPLTRGWQEQQLNNRDLSSIFSKLVMGTQRALQMFGYPVSFSSLFTEALEVNSVPKRPNVPITDAVKLEWVSRLLPMLLPQHHFSVLTALALFLGSGTPTEQTALLSYLTGVRLTSVEEYKAYEKCCLEAAETKLDEFNNQRSKKYTSRKEAPKTASDFLPSDVKLLPFIPDENWVKLRFLSSQFPRCANAMQQMRPGELKGGILREEKWAEWLSQPTAQPPCIEKADFLNPVERFLFVEAISPLSFDACFTELMNDSFFTVGSPSNFGTTEAALQRLQSLPSGDVLLTAFVPEGEDIELLVSVVAPSGKSLPLREYYAVRQHSNVEDSRPGLLYHNTIGLDLTSFDFSALFCRNYHLFWNVACRIEEMQSIARSKVLFIVIFLLTWVQKLCLEGRCYHQNRIFSDDCSVILDNLLSLHDCSLTDSAKLFDGLDWNLMRVELLSFFQRFTPTQCHETLRLGVNLFLHPEILESTHLSQGYRLPRDSSIDHLLRVVLAEVPLTGNPPELFTVNRGMEAATVDSRRRGVLFAAEKLLSSFAHSSRVPPQLSHPTVERVASILNALLRSVNSTLSQCTDLPLHLFQRVLFRSEIPQLHKALAEALNTINAPDVGSSLRQGLVPIRWELPQISLYPQANATIWFWLSVVHRCCSNSINLLQIGCIPREMDLGSFLWASPNVVVEALFNDLCTEHRYSVDEHRVVFVFGSHYKCFPHAIKIIGSVLEGARFSSNYPHHAKGYVVVSDFDEFDSWPKLWTPLEELFLIVENHMTLSEEKPSQRFLSSEVSRSLRRVDFSRPHPIVVRTRLMTTRTKNCAPTRTSFRDGSGPPEKQFPIFSDWHRTQVVTENIEAFLPTVEDSSFWYLRKVCVLLRGPVEGVDLSLTKI